MSVPATAPRDLDTSFMAGGGELGQLLRSHDWAATPLGPPGQWPRSLKTVVRIMLTSRQPIWIGWRDVSMMRTCLLYTSPSPRDS